MKTLRIVTMLAVTVAYAIPTWADEAKPSWAKWEKSIAKFEERDKENPPPKGAILFYGSSSIVFWKTDEAFPEFTTINRGFGGSTTPDALHFMDRVVFPYEPRQIVFYEGDNDIAGGATAEEVVEDTKTFVSRVHEALPETEILYIAIKPSIARWKLVDVMRDANAQIAELAKKIPNLTFVDIDTPMMGEDGKPRESLFISDGLHLNDEGYAIWNRIVEPLLIPDK